MTEKITAMQDVGYGPPAGLYTATHIRCVRYGPDSINELGAIMDDILRNSQDAKPKCLIVTGKSLAAGPIIPHIEELLKKKDAYGGTFTKIRQHTPIDDVEAALEVIRKEEINILLGCGGGSPIDACKALSKHHKDRFGSFLPHIAVPTTLSAAEFTQLAGQTNREGKKEPIFAEEICPTAVVLDAKLTKETPNELWLSTGIRALDHAFEGLYRPKNQYPMQQLALIAIRDLFTYLPQCKDPKGDDLEARQRLQMAAWMSLYPSRLDTSLGPSHVLGHALGATYSIPHGICSVLTLAPTIRLMAKKMPAGYARSMLANVFSYLPTSYVRDHYTNTESDDPEVNACLAGAVALDKLINQLGLQKKLSDYKVPKEDLPKLAKTVYSALQAKPEWQTICPSEHDILTEILERIY